MRDSCDKSGDRRAAVWWKTTFLPSRCFTSRDRDTLYLSITSTQTVITKHTGREKMHRSTVSGAPIDGHGICETTSERRKFSGDASEMQLQRVIKVPLSAIIFAYFYVLLIWQRNDEQREIKMPLCAAICSYVFTSCRHYSFFPRVKLLELRAFLASRERHSLIFGAER